MQYRLIFTTTKPEKEKKLQKLEENINIWVAKNKGKSKADWLLELSTGKH